MFKRKVKTEFENGVESFFAAALLMQEAGKGAAPNE